MTVNDRLRATTNAVTASMREVRPLTLPPDAAPLPPDPHPDRHRRRSPAAPGHRSRRWPGWGSWLIPLAAAVAVIAVATTLVTVMASTPGLIAF